MDSYFQSSRIDEKSQHLSTEVSHQIPPRLNEPHLLGQRKRPKLRAREGVNFN